MGARSVTSAFEVVEHAGARMDGMEPEAGRRQPRIRRCWAVASSAVVVALIVIGIVVAQRVTELPAANLDYSVVIADGVQPVTSNGQIAAIARHYLDEQTRELAAPGIHVPPRILSVTATLARSAHDLEAGVPDAPAAAAPERVVWVVRASGDFLNLQDLPWSTRGTPYPSGTLVIDDATDAILGVYPHAPGG
jgi:hypothetical protein